MPASVIAKSAGSSPRTKRIEDIRVGDRVLADNPTGAKGWSLGNEVDPATWRKVELRAPKRDGTWADVTLLRPQSWFEEDGVEVGGTALLSVPECGISGRADVVSIIPCPTIRLGAGRVVTGTYRHSSAQVVNLHVRGLSAPIGTTANHKFWSEDRHAFVRADSFQPGEGLRSLGGFGRVDHVEVGSRSAVVYNLEIQIDHTYHVSSLGVLVHNGDNEGIPLLPETYGVGNHTSNGTSVIYEVRGQVDGEEQFYVGQMGTRDRWRQSQRYEKVQNLMLNGTNVTISIRTVDYSELEAVMKAGSLTEAQARAKITKVAEYQILEAAKKSAGIVINGETKTVDGKAYHNLNDPLGNLISRRGNPTKPEDYVESFGSISTGKTRVSNIVETIAICPKK